MKKTKTIHKRQHTNYRKIKHLPISLVFNLPQTEITTTYAYLKSLLVLIDAYVGNGSKIMFVALQRYKLYLYYGYTIDQPILEILYLDNVSKTANFLKLVTLEPPYNSNINLERYQALFPYVTERAVDYSPLFDEAIAVFGSETEGRIEFGPYHQASGSMNSFGPLQAGQSTPQVNVGYRTINGINTNIAPYYNQSASLACHVVGSTAEFDFSASAPVNFPIGEVVPRYYQMRVVTALTLINAYVEEGSNSVPAGPAEYYRSGSVLTMGATLASTFKSSNYTCFEPWRFTKL